MSLPHSLSLSEPLQQSPSNAVLSCLALFHTPGVGATRYHKLVEWFGSAEAVITGDRKLISAAGIKAESVRLLDEYAHSGLASQIGCRVKKDLDWAAAPGNDIVLLEDLDYPPLLKHIDMPPPVLYVRGRRALLSEPQLAIVGSRNPSIDGKENAYRFAKAIVNVGLAVTSGMALGVDGVAHKGAIDGGGHTIAVVGTGADIVYPARHRALSEAIMEQGVIVSELPLGTKPQPSNFPRRNRIISALSLGVLVAEASPRSGSLITAHCALDQGREVYAIPGSIHNPMARGCHQLLRQGAKLVESADDIFEELSSLLAFHQLIRSDAAHQSTLNRAEVEHPPITNDLFATHHGAAGRIDGDGGVDGGGRIDGGECIDESIDDGGDGSRNDVVSNVVADVADNDELDLTDAERGLLKLLGYDVVSVDLAVERSELSVEEISILLMSLELKGVVQSVPGGVQKVREGITA